MSTDLTLRLLEIALNGVETEQGLRLSAHIIPGDVEVLQVDVEDREEFPIYVTIDESQILCVSYLWQEQEIDPSKREELLDALLIMNVPMPLSAFSKVGDQYIIFGALGTQSDANDVLEDIVVLSDNTLDAIEVMADYLK